VAQEIDPHLVKAIIDVAIFLEFSPETVVDADASVQAMEQMANELGMMSDEHKRAFAMTAKSLAIGYGIRERFVIDLPETLGLT
jgi:hypothetical protein